MIKPIIKYLQFLFLILTFLILTSALYFVFTSPLAFQKSITILPTNNSAFNTPTSDKWLDIRETIQKIPPQKTEILVYEVDPLEKYRLTIKQGLGTCSNMSYGLSYYLSENQYPYQIIHLMKPDGFLNGKGHVVMNIPFTYNGENKFGILDIVERGLPTSGGEFIDINKLWKQRLAEVSITPLYQNQDLDSYYFSNFFSNSVIGVMNSDEIESYFGFLDRIYFPLGNKKLEKYFYDAASLVLGSYPKTYVSYADYQKLFGPNKIVKFSAYILIYSLRIIIFVFSFLLIYYAVTGLRKIISK